MEQTLLLIVAFVGVSVITGAVLMLVRDMLHKQRANLSHRLTDPKRAAMPAESTVFDMPNFRPGVTGVVDRWFGRIVAETGLGITAETAFMLAVAVGLLCGGAMFILRENPLAGIAGMETGMLLVIGYLLFRRARRRSEMQELLPDVMDLLARAVRAGESIDQAIALAGETAPEPLGQEFKRCARQVEMGLSLDVAVRSMARRVPLAEMRILAATITVQRQTGGNLPTVLERLVRVIRDRLAYHRQFRATTAAGRVSTFLIAGAAPLVAGYLFTFQWPYIQTFVEKPIGQAMISVSILLQIVGLVWIYRLLSSDY